MIILTEEEANMAFLLLFNETLPCEARCALKEGVCTFYGEGHPKCIAACNAVSDCDCDSS